MRSDFIDGVSVSARRGVRRTPRQIAEHFARSIPNLVALAALQDPATRRKAVAGCRLILWNGTDTRIASIRALADLDPRAAKPVRRLGSHRGARSNLMLHATRVNSRPTLVWAESKLEELWMIELDRRDDLVSYQSQACLLSWPVGTHFVIQVPDLMIRYRSGTTIASVRTPGAMGQYAHAMLAELLPETLAFHGIGYRLYGDMPRQRTVNLRMLGALRWKHPVEREDWYRHGLDRARTRSSFGAVADAFGGSVLGRSRALRALAQCKLDVDLDRPIGPASRVWWR